MRCSIPVKVDSYTVRRMTCAWGQNYQSPRYSSAYSFASLVNCEIPNLWMVKTIAQAVRNPTTGIDGGSCEM